MAIDARAILGRRVVTVLNMGSGSCDETSAGRAQAVYQAAGVADPTIVSVGPPEIESALDQAVAASDVVVVLGGDGTIRTAASKCAQANVALVPLPGGTMNMLPKALYGARGWEQALADTLAHPRIQDVSGGIANDQPFFCVALMGAPTLWADARESLRDGRLGEALQRSVTALRRSGSRGLTYQLGDKLKGSAEAVAVICPLVSRRLGEHEDGLEAAALDPETASGVFRLAVHAIFDDWRSDPSVVRTSVQTASVRGHGRVPVILDGERVKMGREVTVRFRPLAFRAIIPDSP